MRSKLPPLKPLHPDTSINPVKLTVFEKLSTEVILNSLIPGQQGCLKIRKDGPGRAVEAVSAVRGLAVPETPEQRAWIEQDAPAFTK